jgi:hypothetical protein
MIESACRRRTGMTRTRTGSPCRSTTETRLGPLRPIRPPALFAVQDQICPRAKGLTAPQHWAVRTPQCALRGMAKTSVTGCVPAATKDGKGIKASCTRLTRVERRARYAIILSQLREIRFDTCELAAADNFGTTRRSEDVRKAYIAKATEVVAAYA